MRYQKIILFLFTLLLIKNLIYTRDNELLIVFSNELSNNRLIDIQQLAPAILVHLTHLSRY